MKKCEFSETQYSFCFSFEFAKQFLPARVIPFFPNTVDEGKEGGGFDMKINGNYFFQFKIPKYYDKVSNFWRRDWDTFNGPYYKIQLSTDENQFRLLEKLQLKHTNKVYYAAPEFYQIGDIMQYSIQNLIIDKSAVFSLNNLPKYGSNCHDLLYTPNVNYGVLYSEPSRVKKEKITETKELMDLTNVLSLYQETTAINNTILEVNQNLHDYMKIAENSEKPLVYAKRTSTVLFLHFNVTWFPIQIVEK